MSLDLHQLTGEVRDFMVSEIEDDIRRRNLYISPRLTNNGRSQWTNMLLDAAEHGDEDTLAHALSSPQYMVTWGNRPNAQGKPVGASAAETLAEGEFNRYYIRAICLVALEHDIPFVTVYRAKRAWSPRPGSDRMLGSRIDPDALLQDLRTNVGRETHYGVPNGPNSGLSVEF